MSSYLRTRTLRKMTFRLALDLQARYLADYTEYLEEADSYRRGTHPSIAPRRTRQGVWTRRQGYRPEHCEHGRSMWVDYDIACGHCEAGHTMGDPMQRRERALFEAKARVERFEALSATISMLAEHGVQLSQDDQKQIIHAAGNCLDAEAYFARFNN